ncbi:hypothetical protein PACTADRAFT_33394 [Pachysolen tannophilus NRRL Y-2460]|uniref:Cyclin N-terminal domain-containing protein n=1 Tax=Pachysolen tannophilus NRRL Y-2460 TaxID=669874 RepID=A0A1E4TWV4_PACTA|nr:hypothetical protein PACTADRAFT_33394 [Pachysolen tannophilus NRRL Y-2460]
MSVYPQDYYSNNFQNGAYPLPAAHQQQHQHQHARQYSSYHPTQYQHPLSAPFIQQHQGNYPTAANTANHTANAAASAAATAPYFAPPAASNNCGYLGTGFNTAGTSTTAVSAVSTAPSFHSFQLQPPPMAPAAHAQQPQPQPQQQQQQQQQQENAQQEDQPVVTGGVSAILDYDMDQITKFLTLLSINMLKQDQMDSTSLEIKLKNVLKATRLLRSTILLAIIYLSNKIESDNSNSCNNTEDVFTNVIMSLLISNKFNDDSTFTNKSWSQASGLNLNIINKLEIKYLQKLNYNLQIKNDASINSIETSYKNWSLNGIQKTEATTKSNGNAQAQQLSSLPMPSNNPATAFYPSPILEDGFPPSSPPYVTYPYGNPDVYSTPPLQGSGFYDYTGQTTPYMTSSPSVVTNTSGNSNGSDNTFAGYYQQPIQDNTRYSQQAQQAQQAQQQQQQQQAAAAAAMAGGYYSTYPGLRDHYYYSHIPCY